MIVRKEWILDCHAKKRRLPSKSYRLTSGDKDSSSSTDEEGGGGGVGGGNAGDKLSAASRDVGVVVPPDVGVATGSTAGGDGVKAVVPVATGEGEGEDPYGGSTDEESDMDTDDVGTPSTHTHTHTHTHTFTSASQCGVNPAHCPRLMMRRRRGQALEGTLTTR